MPSRDRSRKSWTVFLEGRRHGPYASTQMKVFMAEGGLLPHSQAS